MKHSFNSAEISRQRVIQVSLAVGILGRRLRGCDEI